MESAWNVLLCGVSTKGNVNFACGRDNTSPCDDKSSGNEKSRRRRRRQRHGRCVPVSSYKDLFYKIGSVGEILQSIFRSLSSGCN